MNHTIFIFFFLLISQPTLEANECFNSYMNFASLALKDASDKAHTEATNTLREAIQNCNLSLEERKEVLSRLDSIYNAINETYIKQKEQADEERNKADSLRNVAVLAQNEALENAKTAKKNAFKSEARRLASLSDRVSTNNELKLNLAYEAKILMDASETLPDVITTFGEAVRDSTIQVNSSQGGSINDLLVVDNTLLLAKGNTFGNHTTALDYYVSGHNQAILSLSLLEEEIVSIARDNLVKFWNKELQALRTFDYHKQKINFVKRSSDKNFYLTGAKDQLAVLWTKDSRKIAIMNHSGSVLDGDFALNGKRILTRSSDNSVHLWDDKGTEIKKLSLDSYVYAAIFLDKGNYIITADAQGKINKYDPNGNLIGSYGKQGNPAINLIKSRDGQHFIAIYADGTGILGSSKSMQPFPLHKETTGEQIRQAVFSPIADLFLIQSKNELRLMNYEGQTKTKIKTSSLTSVKMSDNGKYIMTTDTENTLKIYNTKGNLLLNIIDIIDPFLDSQFYPNNEQIVVYTKTGRLITCTLPDFIYDKMKNDPPTWSEEEIKEYSLSDDVKKDLVTN